MKRKSKGMIILLVCFGLLAGGLFLLSAILNGWDVIGWLQSPVAILLYFLIVVFLLLASFIWFNGKN